MASYKHPHTEALQKLKTICEPCFDSVSVYVIEDIVDEALEKQVFNWRDSHLAISVDNKAVDGIRSSSYTLEGDILDIATSIRLMMQENAQLKTLIALIKVPI